MTIVEVLRAVRELLSVPERWTQGAFARQEDKTQVNAEDPEAVCFCIRGAIHRVAVNHYEEARAACKLLEEGVPEYSKAWGLSGYNDSRSTTHADMLELIDGVIATIE